jgi:hypothetical protein
VSARTGSRKGVARKPVERWVPASRTSSPPALLPFAAWSLPSAISVDASSLRKPVCFGASLTSETRSARALSWAAIAFATSFL